MISMIEGNDMLERAKAAKRESKYVDFKEGFDISSSQDWCEIIKDIVAMANSGGGVILVGVRNGGDPSDFDVRSVLSLDPAKLTDKIAKYTGEQFAGFEITEVSRNKRKAAALLVNGVPIPIVFIKPGTYDVGGGQQRTAFGRGTVYFRHGAKSEPGDSNDLRRAVERELERIRKSWLGSIRKVVKAPKGYRVQVLPPEVIATARPEATPIRIVDTPSAPPYRIVNPDKTHPYRQKELVPRVNERLKGRKRITTYDLLCVRRVHKIDGAKPEFCYEPKFGSPQYSDQFVDWLVQNYEEDFSFFQKARNKYSSTR